MLKRVRACECGSNTGSEDGRGVVAVSAGHEYVGGTRGSCNVLWSLVLVHMHMLCRHHSIPISSLLHVYPVLSLFCHRYVVHG